MRSLALSFLAMSLLSAAGSRPELPYSQNVVQHVTFDPQGTWTITGIAGVSDVPSLTRVRRHRLLDSEITVRGGHVKFSGVKFMPPRQAFSPLLLSQETQDTQSKEFLFDLATDPKVLNLPRYVSVINVEVGTFLATQDGRAWLEYQGIWFTLERVGRGNHSTP